MDTIYFDDAPLPGYDHRLIVQEQIERKDASGETSAGAQNHQGWKPAVLTITLKLRWDDAQGRFALKNIWTARELDGTPAVWKLTHPLLDSLNITEARCTDFLNISPQEKAHRWDAVFNMIEVRSTAAQRESREMAARDLTDTVDDLLPADGALDVTAADGKAPAKTTPEGLVEELLFFVESGLGKLYKRFTS